MAVHDMLVVSIFGVAGWVSRGSLLEVGERLLGRPMNRQMRIPSMFFDERYVGIVQRVEATYMDLVLYETLGLLPGLPNANLLPIFPKHTLLQNNTLAIQVPTPMLSLLISPSYIL